MVQKPKRLTDPLFLTSLILLLLNDFVLKSAFSNWWTGKLSDVAGLFAFPFFWSVLFPRFSKHIHFLTVPFFIFWKSPWSDPLLTWAQTMGLEMARVVDYSDLLALPLVLCSYLYFEKRALWRVRWLSPWVPLCVACFAFLATTAPRDQLYRVDLDTRYTFDFGLEELVRRVNVFTRNRLKGSPECSEKVGLGYCYDSKERCFYSFDPTYEKDTLSPHGVGWRVKDTVKGKAFCLIDEKKIHGQDSIFFGTSYGDAYLKGTANTSSLYIKEVRVQMLPDKKMKKERWKKERLARTFELMVISRLKEME